MTSHNEIVKVRGEEYKVIGIGEASRDPKFWGRRRFTLRKLHTMEIWLAYGKSVQHNSRLVKGQNK